MKYIITWSYELIRFIIALESTYDYKMYKWAKIFYATTAVVLTEVTITHLLTIFVCVGGFRTHILGVHSSM